MKKIVSLFLALCVVLVSTFSFYDLNAATPTTYIPSSRIPRADGADGTSVLPDTQPERDQLLQDFKERYPEEYAKFEPFAWYEQEYYYLGTAQQYMEKEGYTEQEFIDVMTTDWLWYMQVLESREVLIQVFIDANQDKYAGFTPESWFAEHYTYWDTPEEYMKTYSMGQREFRLEMLEDWMYEIELTAKQNRQFKEFVAQYPELYADFDANAYFSVYYYYYDSPQTYMEAQQITAEEFQYAMELNWMMLMKNMIAQGNYLGEIKQEYGGYADGINVMIDGTCITFPDARPEIVDDRTMVPMRATLERLGAAVQYQTAEHTVVATLGTTVLTHKIGSDTIAVSDGSAVTMDAVSYIRDGRTMIPVSFFAEVLGYSVGWDQTYQTAILLDRAGMVQQADSQLTMLNRIWALIWGESAERDGTMQVDATGKTWSVDGKTGTTNIQLDWKQQSGTINYSLQADFSALARIYYSYLFDGEPDGWIATKEEELMIRSLADASMKAILPTQSELIYLQGVVPEYLVGTEWAGWLEAPYDMAAIAPLLTDYTATFGERIVAALTAKPNFFTWSNYEKEVERIVELCGDKTAKKTGDTAVITVDCAGLSQLFTGLIHMLGSSWEPTDGELVMTLSVVDGQDRLDTTLRYVTGIGTLKVTLKGTAQHLDVSLHYDEPRLFGVELSGTVLRSDEVNDVQSAPNAGAHITKADELEYR